MIQIFLTGSSLSLWCLVQVYGNIEYAIIIRNKTTGESKGLGYVRFHKPSQAAKAIENCDKSKFVIFSTL